MAPKKTKLQATFAVFAPTGHGPLMLDARAYGEAYPAYEMSPRTELSADAIRVVPVRGPLMHHPTSWWASYEALVECVRAEIKMGARAIIGDFDSPGGLVSGCFEAAAAIKAECDAAGVLWVAYVGSQCCSAAYALAAGASFIAAPPASQTGSVGVIEPLTDLTKNAEAFGVRHTLITSGARKADGNPMAEVTPDVVAARQVHVDDLALEFFAWVAQNRPGLTVDSVRALEAGSFAGKRALSHGLVDAVMDLDALKKRVAQALESGDDLRGNPPSAESGTGNQEKPPMASKARKALQAILDDDKASDEEKKDAEAGLKAMGAEGGEEDEDEEGGDDDSAETDEEESEEKKDEAAAKAAAAGNPVLAAALAKVPNADASAISKLLKSRPDLPKDLATTLRSQPLAVVRHMVASYPKGSGTPAPKTPAAGQSPVRAARAALQSAGKPLQAAPQVGGAPHGTPQPMRAAASAGGGPYESRNFTLVDKGHMQTFSVARPRAQTRNVE